jgi:hypothetical protein
MQVALYQISITTQVRIKTVSRYTVGFDKHYIKID